MLILLVFTFLICYFVYRQFYAKRKGLPPGPMPLPLVGNIFQLDIANLHENLLRWKKEYGNIFTVWIPDPYVIVSDHEALKEYFLKQGEVFAGRPVLNLMKDFAGGMYGLVLNDNAWYKRQRRFALHVLRDLGFGRPILQNTVIDQAKKMVQLLEAKKGVPLDLISYFTNSVGNVIYQLVFGYTREFDDPEIHFFKRNMDVVSGALGSPIGFLIELSPKFKILDPLFGGAYTNAKQKSDEIIECLKKEINQHRMTIDYDGEPRDYIDAFLQEMHRREKDGNPEEFTEIQLIAAIFDLFGAGLETTATSSREFILYMLHYPEIQTKIHEELDRVIGREHTITMADQSKLPYLNACIQELQRVAVLLPLNGQHIVLEDVQMGEYFIPKNTVVIPQFQSVHLDENVYPDPKKFIPERHLDPEGAFKKDDRIMPFSLGKRACLGENLARMEMFLFLSHLFQKFEFLPIEEGKLPKMEYTTGFLRAPLPFLCRVVARK